MITSNTMQIQIQELKKQVDNAYKQSIFSNDTVLDAKYNHLLAAHKIAVFIGEVAEWRGVAFTSEDLESFIPWLRTNEAWGYFDFLILGHLEHIGMIKRFGERAWRLSTTHAGSLVDPYGNFVGQLEVIKDESPLNDFRSYLVNNESSLLAMTGGESN